MRKHWLHNKLPPQNVALTALEKVSRKPEHRCLHSCGHYCCYIVSDCISFILGHLTNWQLGVFDQHMPGGSKHMKSRTEEYSRDNDEILISFCYFWTIENGVMKTEKTAAYTHLLLVTSGTPAPQTQNASACLHSYCENDDIMLELTNPIWSLLKHKADRHP